MKGSFQESEVLNSTFSSRSMKCSKEDFSHKTPGKSLSQPYSRWARCSQSGSKKVPETLPFRLAVSREVSNRLGKLNISLWGAPAPFLPRGIGSIVN